MRRSDKGENMKSNWQELDVKAHQAQLHVEDLEHALEAAKKAAIEARVKADAEFARWQQDKQGE